MSDEKPDESTQYFQTQTPTDVFQIFDQNISIASRMGEDMAKRMYAVCLSKLASFSLSLQYAIYEYREEKFKDRQKLMNFTPVMMALVNDCSRYIEFVQLWQQKRSALGHGELLTECYTCFEHLRVEAMNVLLEEPMHDLHLVIKDLFTPAWQKAPMADSMHTIAATFKDYGSDYQQHLTMPNFRATMEIAQLKILRYYLQVRIRFSMEKDFSFNFYRNILVKNFEGEEKMPIFTTIFLWKISKGKKKCQFLPQFSRKKLQKGRKYPIDPS